MKTPVIFSSRFFYLGLICASTLSACGGAASNNVQENAARADSSLPQQPVVREDSAARIQGSAPVQVKTNLPTLKVPPPYNLATANGGTTPNPAYSTGTSGYNPAGSTLVSSGTYFITPNAAATTAPSGGHTVAQMCSIGNSAYPPQFTWSPKFASQARAATASDNLTPKIEQVRNGAVIATYSSFGSLASCKANFETNASTNLNNLAQAAQSGCGVFGLKSHVDLYRMWQPGDVFLVYPAVYSGPSNNIFIGPRPDYYHDPVEHVPNNITIQGVTVNGIRPVILDPAPDGDFASNQAPIYIWNGGTTLNGTSGGATIPATGHNPSGVKITNIDLAIDKAIPGFNGKAGIYSNGSDNLTLSQMRIHGFEMITGNTYGANGVFNTVNDTGTLELDQMELYDNGGAEGPAHNIYINVSEVDPNYTVHMVNSWSHDVHFGHTFKSRARTNILEGNYFQGGTPQTALGYTQAENYLVDIPNGGVLKMHNNVLVKSISGPNSNGASVTFDVEGLNPEDGTLARTYSADIENNTFVTFGSTYDGSHPNWPIYFYKGIVPNTAGFQVPTLPTGSFAVPSVTVARNVFAGYCQQSYSGYQFMNYRGDQAVIATFGDLSNDFALSTYVLSADVSNAGNAAYLHAAQGGASRYIATDGLQNYTILGAEDF